MLAHPQKVGVLSTAVALFANGKDQWDHCTIVTMARAFSALLLSNQTAPETIVALRKLFNDDPEHVVKLIDNCNLNVIVYLTQEVQAIAGFLIRLSEPSMLIFNKIKRMLIDTIRKQLGSVSLVTVPQLACELAYFDYWSKYKLNTSQIAHHSLIQSFFVMYYTQLKQKRSEVQLQKVFALPRGGQVFLGRARQPNAWSRGIGHKAHVSSRLQERVFL